MHDGTYVHTTHYTAPLSSFRHLIRIAPLPRRSQAAARGRRGDGDERPAGLGRVPQRRGCIWAGHRVAAAAIAAYRCGAATGGVAGTALKIELWPKMAALLACTATLSGVKRRGSMLVRAMVQVHCVIIVA